MTTSVPPEGVGETGDTGTPVMALGTNEYQEPKSDVKSLTSYFKKRKIKKQVEPGDVITGRVNVVPPRPSEDAVFEGFLDIKVPVDCQTQTAVPQLAGGGCSQSDDPPTPNLLPENAFNGFCGFGVSARSKCVQGDLVVQNQPPTSLQDFKVLKPLDKVIEPTLQKEFVAQTPQKTDGQPTENETQEEPTAEEVEETSREPVPIFTKGKVSNCPPGVWFVNQYLQQHLHESGTQGFVHPPLHTKDGKFQESRDYRVKAVIGRGAFGTVRHCELTDTQMEMVVKQVPKAGFRRNEALVASSINSENVVKFYGLIQELDMDRSEKMLLFLEFGGLSLEQYMQRKRSHLTESHFWDLLLQGLRGLQCFKKYGFIHLDIKPDNLLVSTRSGRLLLKIADMGSSLLSQDEVQVSVCTVEYMSPEMCQLTLKKRCRGNWDVNRSHITGKTDVYSLGLVGLFMVQGFHVLVKYITQGQERYDNEEQCGRCRTLLVHVIAKNPTLIESLKPDTSKCSHQFMDLTMGMTAYNHEARLGTEEAIRYIQENTQLKKHLPPRPAQGSSVNPRSGRRVNNTAHQSTAGVKRHGGVVDHAVVLKLQKKLANTSVGTAVPGPRPPTHQTKDSGARDKPGNLPNLDMLK